METRTRGAKRSTYWGARALIVPFFVILGAACGADGNQDEVQTPSSSDPTSTSIDVGQNVPERSIESWRRRRRTSTSSTTGTSSSTAPPAECAQFGQYCRSDACCP